MPSPIDRRHCQPWICVLGEAILDRYTCGSAEGISPEAPVVVLNVNERKREVQLNGAANIAVQLRALDVETIVAGVIGEDQDYRKLRCLIDKAVKDATPLIINPAHPKTVNCPSLILASLECGDHEVIFDNANPIRMLEAIHSDVLAKGRKTFEVVGREIAKSTGGPVVWTHQFSGRSTAPLLSQIRSIMNLE